MAKLNSSAPAGRGGRHAVARGGDAPNRRAERPAAPTRPNAVWGTGCASIPTAEGWLFLAVVLDRYSRRVVGGAFATALNTALALAALAMSLTHRRPPAGRLHHSDRGRQYASAAHRAALAAHGLVASMRRRANPYDNAARERCDATLKGDGLDREPWPPRAAAQAATFAYLETLYNRERRPSALGSQAPVDFQQTIN